VVALGAIVVAIGGRVGAEESAASLEAELPGLIADCNRVVEGGTGKRRAMRACKTLATANLLDRAEPAASAAYERYRADQAQDQAQWQACHRSELRISGSCPHAGSTSTEQGTIPISTLRADCDQPSAPDVPADVAIGSRADKRLSREIVRFVSDSAEYVSCLRGAVVDPTAVGQKQAEALHAVTTLFDLYETRVGHSDELIAKLTEIGGAVNSSHLSRAAAIQRAVESDAIQTLNAAIAYINARRFGEARAVVRGLDLEALSSFERSKAEQVLYTIAYEEERFEDAQEHVRRSIDAGGLSADDEYKARLALANLDVMLLLRGNQAQRTAGQVVE
jgi:hypothetical protein